VGVQWERLENVRRGFVAVAALCLCAWTPCDCHQCTTILQAAYKHVKHLLPLHWTCELETLLQRATEQLPHIQRLIAGQASASTLREILLAVLAYDESSTACRGCGRVAVGVRRCLRCRAAKYCRQACRLPRHAHAQPSGCSRYSSLHYCDDIDNLAYCCMPLAAVASARWRTGASTSRSARRGEGAAEGDKRAQGNDRHTAGLCHAMWL
jgi:hypothetical protein